MGVEYDSFAEVYDFWVQGAPVAERDRPYYVAEYVRTEGPVVELGVGTGRVAIEAARQEKAVIGVDSSVEMLARCRERAEAAGVLPLLTLIQADFRDFMLLEPAALIAIPFHTIGHLVSLEDKRHGLRHIYDQLAPGGRFLFSHFVFNDALARRIDGLAQLHAEVHDPPTRRDSLLWSCACYDFPAQTIRLVTWTDDLDEEGLVLRRKYRRL